MGAKMVLIAALAAHAAGQQPPSAADVIEHRGAAPPAVGTRTPAVGFETTAPLPYPSVLEGRDGRWIMIGSGKISYSGDGGKTWSRPEALAAPVDYAVRLRSGKLGGPGAENASAVALGKRGILHFYVSGDEGKTWQKRGLISVGDVPGSPYPKTLIQLKTGRLVLPVRFTDGAGHMGLYSIAGAYGVLNGKFTMIEGHAHFPEPDNAFAYYSDDEGETWRRSEGGIMVWLDEGYGGMWPCDEPSVAETRGGDVVMYCRTSLGRIYTAHSGASDPKFTPGQRFDNPAATTLAASYSPCAIQRVPKTGDLLIVWNQVSGDEIRAGYRRGRLSSAVSRDDGKTWEHFRTIDSMVLPPMGRVAPDTEPRLARGLDFVGVLPADYGGVDYPTINVLGDHVLLCWDRSVVARRPGDVVGRRMRGLPLSWFYEEEPHLPPGPGLMVDTGRGEAARVPADFYEGRFYCRLSDIEKYLKSAVGRLDRDMYAPVEQVVTALGWTARYEPRNGYTLVVASPPAASRRN
jgi:hypothetical protein